jgi:molybdate transport system substrate-binding protein
MDNSVRVLSTLALKGAVSHLAGHYEAANGVRIDADSHRHWRCSSD